MLQESGLLVLEKGTEADVKNFLALEQKLVGPTFFPVTEREEIIGDDACCDGSRTTI